MIGLFLMGSLCITSHARAQEIVRLVRHYVESDGNDSYKVVWDLTHCRGFRLVYRKATEVHVTETDESLATRSWSMNDPLQQCSLRATRENNVISVKGRCRGKRIDKHIEVDNAPWFQATSLSLRGFVLSEQEEIQFWVLRPGTCETYKLRAVKVGLDRLTVMDKPVASVKVQLRPTGWLSPFWKSHYWYDAADGLFMRFEGPANASGTKLLIVAYTGESAHIQMSCP